MELYYNIHYILEKLDSVHLMDIRVLLSLINILLLVTFSILGLVLLVDLLRQDRSKTHSLWSLLKHYYYNLSLYYHGSLIHRRILNDCKSFNKVQRELVLERISRNKDTMYGRDHNFASISKIQDFLRMHPLCGYEHYASYIDKIIRGEQNVMLKDKVVGILETTSVKDTSKRFPYTEQWMNLYFYYCQALLYRAMWHYPSQWAVEKILRYMGVGPRNETPRGLPITPLSCAPGFNTRNAAPLCSPKDVYDIREYEPATYVHLVFALREAGLRRIDTAFSSNLLLLFEFMEKHWKDLVDDIKNGTLHHVPAGLSDQLKNKLLKSLKPMPDRARELHEEFSRGFNGISKRIWRNIDVIMSVTTGHGALYETHLEEKYTQGVNLFSPVYGACEGPIGINLWPKSPTKEYLLIPRWLYYEFINFNEVDEPNPEVFRPSEVKVGKMYFLVISTVDGLYRYKLGDVLLVTRFIYQAPVVEFMYRQKALLNMMGELTNEYAVFAAISRACSMCGVRIYDYSTAESTTFNSFKVFPHSPLPYYIILLELESATTPIELEEKIDACLQTRAPRFRDLREGNQIGPPRVIYVKTGTFNEFRDYLIKKHKASPLQIKMPRLITLPDKAAFMMERIVPHQKKTLLDVFAGLNT